MQDHMAGRLDPRTKQPYSQEIEFLLGAYDPSNALHNSVAADVPLAARSADGQIEDLDNLSVQQLKVRIHARGGNLTDHEGKALTRIKLLQLLRAWECVDSEVPTVRQHYFDRNTASNGIFARIDTNNGANVLDIINKLCDDPSFFTGQGSFFYNIRELLRADKFLSDLSENMVECPDLPADIIYTYFAHIGFSKQQKNVRKSFQRSLDLEASDLIYHAVARHQTDRGDNLYLISKQQASYDKDEKTRKKTPIGEKPMPSTYLALIEYALRPTTVDKEGHLNGCVTHIVRAFCALCKAGGGGSCIHIAQASWVQHHLSNQRRSDKGSTCDLCSFLQRTKRKASVTQPASNLQCIKLPESHEEAEYRAKRGGKRNSTVGLNAQYDVFNGNERKRDCIRNGRMFSEERPQIQRFFAALRKDNKKRDHCQSSSPWEETGKYKENEN
jgi:hypothetical protein